MRAEKIVSSLLNASVAVAAIAGTRIFGGAAPEDATAPLVVYRKAGGTREGLLDPANNGEIVAAAIDVLVIAATYDVMKSLGDAVRLTLVHKRGTVASEWLLGVEVLDEGPDQYDEELREHGQVWTYEVKHTEPCA
jgi:hypothetical protein